MAGTAACVLSPVLCPSLLPLPRTSNHVTMQGASEEPRAESGDVKTFSHPPQILELLLGTVTAEFQAVALGTPGYLWTLRSWSSKGQCCRLDADQRDKGQAGSSWGLP